MLHFGKAEVFRIDAYIAYDPALLMHTVLPVPLFKATYLEGQLRRDVTRVGILHSRDDTDELCQKARRQLGMDVLRSYLRLEIPARTTTG